MSKGELEFFKQLKVFLLKISGVLLTTIILATVPFYFNTKNDSRHMKQEISDLKLEKADKDVYQINIQEIKSDISEIKADIKSIKK